MRKGDSNIIGISLFIEAERIKFWEQRPTPQGGKLKRCFRFRPSDIGDNQVACAFLIML